MILHTLLFFYLIIDKSIAITKCQLCKSVVEICEERLFIGNKTLHDIEIVIEDLCYDIGGNVVWKECEYLINNIQIIINYLLEGLKPIKICESIGYC